MGGFQAVIDGSLQIMQTEINVIGYDVTFFQIFIFFTLAGVVLSFFFGSMD